MKDLTTLIPQVGQRFRWEQKFVVVTDNRFLHDIVIKIQNSESEEDYRVLCFDPACPHYQGNDVLPAFMKQHIEAK